MVLHNVRADGSSLYEHCQAIQKATGEWPREYPLPDIPEAAANVWGWYWELRQCVPFGFNGPGPLLYSELESWARLFQIEITARDIYLLMALDRQYMECWYSDQKKRSKAKK